MLRPIFRAAATLTAAVVLAGCVTTQAGRIGYDDGTDPCRPQLVALDSTGDFFGEDILAGAAIGAATGALVGGLASGRWQGALIGAAVGGLAGGATGYYAAVQRQARDQFAVSMQIAHDLSRENAQLDRTQVAFNQLMDCRFRSAENVRMALRMGRISRPMAEAQMSAIRGQTERDIALARSISGRIGTRGAQFDTAVDGVVPGGKAVVVADARMRSRAVQATARRPVPVTLTPSSSSVTVAQINPRDVVTVRPAEGGFALVETSSGQRGYAPAEAFQPATRGAMPAAAPAAAEQPGDVRSLAATNLTRRENFNESVGNAERLARSGGFELAS